MKILAVSGSLRSTSKHMTLLRAIEEQIEPPFDVQLSGHPELLPQFNPDLEDAGLPAVEEWRAALRAADIVLISSPEYAHSMPGTLKNALDWCVGSGEFVGKPVVLLQIEPRAVRVQAALREVLTAMDASVQEDVMMPFESLHLHNLEITLHPEDVKPLLLVLRGVQQNSPNLEK
jgi:chromate reductase, NAD(P)H dehydrogenase (quinone)